VCGLCRLWFWCFRKSCLSVNHQSDNSHALSADQVSTTQQTENTETAENGPVCRSSIAEGNVFTNCNAEQQHVCRRRSSRLSSTGSAECLCSIFDYHSTHPSVDLSDVCSDSIDLDDISVGRISVDMGTNDSSSGMIPEKKQTTAVVPQSTEVIIPACSIGLLRTWTTSLLFFWQHRSLSGYQFHHVYHPWFPYHKRYLDYQHHSRMPPQSLHWQSLRHQVGHAHKWFTVHHCSCFFCWL